MIYDTLQNASHYHTLSPRFAAAFRFLASPESRKLDPGKHTVDGQEIFAIVQEYQTEPADGRFWETHQRYIDIQFMLSGTERMGYSPAERMKVIEPYDPIKDFTKLAGDGQFIEVPAGHFTIFFPHDAHMGGVSIAGPERVRKIVVKVAV